MVLFNLTKLNKFIGLISKIPKSLPKRKDRLIEAYSVLDSDTDDTVSIKLKATLERFKEIHIDLEKDCRKKLILESLIEHFTSSGICIPNSDYFKTFLIPDPKKCLNIHCSSFDLVIIRPTRTENSIPIFTQNGILEGEVYRKTCNGCKATYFYSYWEFENTEGKTVRTYYKNSEEQFFSVTNESFFEKVLLEELTEQLVTCHVQFVNWTTAYNRLKSKGNNKLTYKVLIAAWTIYVIWKKVPVCFVVTRDKARNLDVESACGELYQDLKSSIDKRWINHKCELCETRLIVMDGDAKVYRTVCSHETTKTSQRGELNVFNACAQNPLPGKDKCAEHDKDPEAVTDDRLDLGMMTRQKRAQLGMSVDQLTTEEGCRKREAITVRTNRSKTAGMLYAIRTCGMIMGHMELISSESCTAFLTLLFELFGEEPNPQDITGVAVDRACDIHPYCKRIGMEGNKACALYAQIAWMVDPFHIKGHIEPKCSLDHPDCIYHPNLPEHVHLSKDMNLEICEQSFRKVNKWKHTTRYLTVNKRLVFFKIMDDERNIRLEEQIAEKLKKPPAKKRKT